MQGFPNPSMYEPFILFCMPAYPGVFPETPAPRAPATSACRHGERRALSVEARGVLPSCAVCRGEFHKELKVRVSAFLNMISVMRPLTTCAAVRYP